MRSWVMLLLGAALVAAFPAGSAAAEDYRLGPDDVLQISVWERPDLTRSVTIRTDGRITFPPVGDMQASGRTAPALARDLEDRLSELLRKPTQVTVEVKDFGSQSVTVTGAVASPGKYGFEKIPSLAELLGSAGGMGPGADLGRVQILRTVDGRQTTLTVDLSETIRSGDLSKLPPLQTGDLIFVPSIGGAATTPGASGDAVYIAGEVGKPGPYGIGAGLDLLKMLSLAGGPLPTADLSHVQVVAPDPEGGSYAVTINLERYLSRGTSGFFVRPGDAVHVPRSGRQGTAQVWSATREVLGISRDVLNLFLISDVLNN